MKKDAVKITASFCFVISKAYHRRSKERNFQKPTKVLGLSQRKQGDEEMKRTGVIESYNMLCKRMHYPYLQMGASE